MKRTDLNFDRHELTIEEDKYCKVYKLKIPGTFHDSIIFINSNGIMSVTGDYGNWVFCREFHPSSIAKVSGSYWCEKLSLSSSQDPYEFDPKIAQEEITEYLKDYQDSLSDEEKEWLNELYDEAVEGEYSYIAKAMDRPSTFEAENIPHGKKTKYWLLVIFDAYEEICRRINLTI